MCYGASPALSMTLLIRSLHENCNSSRRYMQPNGFHYLNFLFSVSGNAIKEFWILPTAHRRHTPPNTPPASPGDAGDAGGAGAEIPASDGPAFDLIWYIYWDAPTAAGARTHDCLRRLSLRAVVT
mmetsp:Transcript_25620/g.31077  ORF Transcript_25620/g.31077 Transcript_25620/m.31077 type:complete len:125 (+) Transcript_25620:1220-1594(+)